MDLTLNDITPIALCVATQDLFDAKRFQANFGDNLILRARDKNISPLLFNLKRDLNSSSQKKFLDGHKAVIVNNIDKIISLVSTRYAQLGLKQVQQVIENGKQLIAKVLFAESFDDIARLEPSFRTQITFPVYNLFTDSMKR